MFVPLPDLDDRRWTDLTDEGRSLIPVYAPSWTDHNPSDPGITVMELLAWVADQDVYRVNRIPDTHLLAFLSLIDITPEPPVAARAAVQFVLKSGTKPQTLPATTELDAALLDASSGKFALRGQVTALPVALSAVQVQSGGKFRDATGDWTHGKPIAIFGFNPQPGDALYLGFSGLFQAGDLLSLCFEFEGANATAVARERIIDELESRAQACAPTPACGSTPPPALPAVLPPHYSVSVVWEAQTQPGVWRALNVADDTRSMTLNGGATVTMQPLAVLRTGSVATPLGYIRCRFAAGAFDAAPSAKRILENAMEAEQSSPVWQQWAIAPGVVAIGAPPAPGQPSQLRFSFDALGQIQSLEFDAAASDSISIVVLAFKPSTPAQPGAIVVEAAVIGTGSGAPNQLYQLPGPRLCQNSLTLYTIENSGLTEWSPVGSFVASGPADKQYVPDAEDAEVLFGDGETGRVPPAGAPVVVLTKVTNGAVGNAAAGSIAAFDPGPHNAALFDVAAMAANFDSIHNPDAAWGATDQETIAHTEGRAALVLNQPERAVTLADCEALALATPGTWIARAAAIVNCCPGLPCYSALGFITVVIVPYLPVGRPVPSAGLMATVSSYLNRRRVIGTRIVVTGPDYLEVAVIASVKAVAGQNKATVQTAIVAALSAFLDPLAGGPDGTGWPLGRAVYVSEILETIAQTPGVDHVLSLQLNAGDCGAQCGDICLDPMALTVSGSHEIQVS
jgi:predicted phage baseplate assembly protein